MGVLVIGSIIFDLYLGERNHLFNGATLSLGQAKLGMNIVLILIETVFAILICWLVGRKKPTSAKK